LIVMPATTPRIKRNAVAALGAKIVLHGDSFDEAEAHARTVAGDTGPRVHPPVRRSRRDRRTGHGGDGDPAAAPGPIRAIFVPVGGGGLIAGVAAYTKRLRPEVRIIGVESADAASMTAALEAGHPVTLDHVGLFADGTAVKRVGDEPFRVCRTLVDQMVVVDTDAICAAIKDVFEDTRAIVEPSGALAVAGRESVGRGDRNAGRNARRDHFRREHELRPLAPRLGTRRAR
jgi:threonine dehydratase